jgi:hypothetical protein
MNPAEAVQAHQDLKSKYSLGTLAINRRGSIRSREGLEKSNG